MKNKSQLFIYPETPESIADFSNWNSDDGKWKMDGGAYRYTGYTGAYHWIELPTTQFVNGGQYRLRYTISGGYETTTSFITTDNTNSLTNTGNGTFTVTYKNVKTTKQRIFMAFNNPKENMYITNVTISKFEEFEVDLYNDENISLNFSVAEIEDFTKRNAGYSKTIIIPGTPNNNKIFKHSYRVSVNNSFKMNTGVRCKLVNSSITIFLGDMYLQNIKLQNKDYTIDYECDLRNTINTLFKVTSEKNLRSVPSSIDDLDFSEYNHALNYNNVKNSWWKGSATPPTVDMIGYPILPGWWKNLPVATGFNDILGKGFVYPLINYGFTQTANWSGGASPINITDMKPALFIKEIFDKIINNAGYSYTSTFLNSDRFKRLIYPRTTTWDIKGSTAAGDGGAEGTALRKYVLRNTGTATQTLNHSNANQPQTTINNLGAMGLHGTPVPGCEIQTVFAGSYTFEADIENYMFGFALTNEAGPVDAVCRNQGTYGSFPNEFSYCATVIFQFERQPYGTSSWIKIGGTTRPTPRKFPFDNTEQSTIKLYKYDNSWTPKAAANKLYVVGPISGVACNAGDKIRLTCYMESPHKTPGTQSLQGTTWNWKKNTGSGPDCLVAVKGEAPINSITMYVSGEGGANIAENDTVQLNYTLHSGIKQSDFLYSIIQMFNLFVDVDKENPNNLIIEPRNDFYTGGEILDWTQKRDFEREFIIEEASEINNRNVLFTWTLDNDVYNTDYNQVTKSATRPEGDIYGENFVSSEIKTKETNKIQPLFAATPMDAFVTQGNKHIVVTPQIFKKDGASKIVTQSYMPRILSWAGLYYYWNHPEDHGYTGWSMNSISDGRKYYNRSYQAPFYPLATHSDIHPLTATFDLNWGNNWWYYFGSANNQGGQYTNNNLVSTYYEKMLTEYTHPDSKKITAWIWLLPQDIAQLNFKDFIVIDAVYYRLNKIVDYVPGKVTKVILLKIEEQILPITPTTGSKWNWWREERYNVYERYVAAPMTYDWYRNDNEISFYDTRTNTLFGNRNKVSTGAANNEIIGDDNIVEAFVTNSTIHGNNNLISYGLNNVHIVNTDNLSVYESDVSYTNGVKIKDGVSQPIVNIINGGLDEVQQMYSPIIINKVDGGLDSARNYGTLTPINKIN